MAGRMAVATMIFLLTCYTYIAAAEVIQLAWPITTTILLPVAIQPGMANCYDIFVAVCTVQQAQHVAVKSESWCVVFWLFVASVKMYCMTIFFSKV